MLRRRGVQAPGARAPGTRGTTPGQTQLAAAPRCIRGSLWEEQYDHTRENREQVKRGANQRTGKEEGGYVQ